MGGGAGALTPVAPVFAQRFARLSIRHKLLALGLLPLAVVLPLLGLVLLAWAGVAFDRMLVTKVRSDLAVAQGYFERLVGDLAGSAGAIAESAALLRVLENGDTTAQATLLQQAQRRHGFDFVNLRGPDGRLRVTQDGAAAPAADTADGGGDPPSAANASVEVLAPAAFARLAPTLAARVPVRLLPTRNAAPTARTDEDRAMVVLAAAPVHAADGRLLGQVQAGVLLNRNLPFIDHLNDIVYPPGALPFGSRGTATLFLDDVRISTNVHLFGGDEAAERAIGTRVSQQVRDAVLGRGSTWLDRAFVVDQWYVSAYRPVEDGARRRVGMLYVGYLERPFTLLKYALLASLGAVCALVMLGAAAVSLRWARAVSRPLERIAETMRRVEGGALDARVGPVASGDEIGQLAGQLDRLIAAVGQQTAALQRWNAELDAKVVERTQALEAAQAQLLRSERLAVMGQLTAGIAHEVNNPVAVIQGNLDVVRELLGDDARRVDGELRLIDQQVERMRRIVTQMLRFARPGDYAGETEAVDTARLVDDSLLLVAHARGTQGVEVGRRLAATRPAAGHHHDLQQVLVNLLLNALHAMPDGGRLELATRDDGEDGVAIDVADTGPGLTPQQRQALFRPFASQRADGTGLGLWISRVIVERHGGDIVAAPRPDGASGAVFTVRLKAAPAP